MLWGLEYTANTHSVYLLVPCNVQAMDPWFLACTTKLTRARACGLCVLLIVQPTWAIQLPEETMERCNSIRFILTLLTCKAGRQTRQTSAGDQLRL